MHHTNRAQEGRTFGSVSRPLLLLLFHDSGLPLPAGCLTANEGGIVVGRVARIPDSPRLPKAIYVARIFRGHVHSVAGEQQSW